VLRRLLPRRLAHGEGAELTEHLGELRHRVVVGLRAFVPAFALAFAFHERIVGLLVRPPPDGRRLVTFGVAEPFTTSVKVSAYAAIALVLPVLLRQLSGFLALALDAATQRAIGVFVVFGTALFVLGVAFSYVVVLPPALDFLRSYDEGLYDILLPTVDPVSLALEAAPLLVVFELSIRLAAVMERRWSGERPQIAQSFAGPDP
jgi:Sec-independent protein secretion pathway component TatC